jgi:glycosyltransferase involved in cell wall biosynthesis
MMSGLDVTLIVPVRNEAATIGAFVETLLGQTLQPAEIVIADGGSTDDTREILRGFVARGAPIRLVEDPDALPGRGRNLAIREARTEWVAMTDAGTKVDPNWLERLVLASERDPACDVVYGTYQPLMSTFFQKCLALAFVPPEIEIDGKHVRGPSTASMMIRARVWKDVGGFREDLRACEDLLFFSALEAKGVRVAAAPDAFVRWSIPSTFRAVFRRFRAYSLHTLKAGLGRSWHVAVARMYAVAAVCVALAAVTHWALVALVPLGLLARAYRSIRLRGLWIPAIGRVGPLTYVVVAVIILWIDLAMFAGLADFLVRKPRGHGI